MDLPTARKNEGLNHKVFEKMNAMPMMTPEAFALRQRAQKDQDYTENRIAIAYQRPNSTRVGNARGMFKSSKMPDRRRLFLGMSLGDFSSGGGGGGVLRRARSSVKGVASVLPSRTSRRSTGNASSRSTNARTGAVGGSTRTLVRRSTSLQQTEQARAYLKGLPPCSPEKFAAQRAIEKLVNQNEARKVQNLTTTYRMPFRTLPFMKPNSGNVSAASTAGYRNKSTSNPSFRRNSTQVSRHGPSSTSRVRSSMRSVTSIRSSTRPVSNMQAWVFDTVASDASSGFYSDGVPLPSQVSADVEKNTISASENGLYPEKDGASELEPSDDIRFGTNDDDDFSALQNNSLVTKSDVESQFDDGGNESDASGSIPTSHELSLYSDIGPSVSQVGFGMTREKTVSSSGSMVCAASAGTTELSEMDSQWNTSEEKEGTVTGTPTATDLGYYSAVESMSEIDRFDMASDTDEEEHENGSAVPSESSDKRSKLWSDNSASMSNIGSNVFGLTGSAISVGSAYSVGVASSVGSASNIGSAASVSSVSSVGSACNVGSAASVSSVSSAGSASFENVASLTSSAGENASDSIDVGIENESGTGCANVTSMSNDAKSDSKSELGSESANESHCGSVSTSTDAPDSGNDDNEDELSPRSGSIESMSTVTSRSSSGSMQSGSTGGALLSTSDAARNTSGSMSSELNSYASGSMVSGSTDYTSDSNSYPSGSMVSESTDYRWKNISTSSRSESNSNTSGSMISASQSTSYTSDSYTSTGSGPGSFISGSSTSKRSSLSSESEAGSLRSIADSTSNTSENKLSGSTSDSGSFTSNSDATGSESSGSSKSRSLTSESGSLSLSSGFMSFIQSGSDTDSSATFSTGWSTIDEDD